jgi:hypothetical protein
MKRRILLATIGLGLLSAALAAPAGANLPNGKGLTEPFAIECGSLGTVLVVAPKGDNADAGFTTTGQHLNVVSITGTFNGPDGPFTFTKNYGKKTGLKNTVTCTAHFEDGDGTGDITVVVATVPPKS